MMMDFFLDNQNKKVTQKEIIIEEDLVVNSLLKIEDQLEELKSCSDKVDFDGCKDIDEEIQREIKDIKRKILCNEIEMTQYLAEIFLDISMKYEGYHDEYRKKEALSRQDEIERKLKEELAEAEAERKITIKQLQKATKQLEETESALKDITEIKNNLLNIFSLIIGILGFIFVNFNVFSGIGTLAIENIITIVSVINLSYVVGFMIMLQTLKAIIFNRAIKWIEIICFILVYFLVTIAIKILLNYI